VLLGFAASAAAIIALAVLGLIGPGRSDGGSNPELSPSVDIGPQSTQTAPAPAPTETPTDAAEAADQKAAMDAGARFTEALFSQSYRDETPNTWITAIEEYSTPRLYEELTADANPDDAGSMWPEYVSERMTDTVIVKRTDTVEAEEYTVVLVEYTLRSTNRSGSYSSEEAHALRVVEQEGQWLVDGVSEDPDDLVGFFEHGDHDHGGHGHEGEEHGAEQPGSEESGSGESGADEHDHDDEGLVH
jgi:hypothetical protein